MQSLNPALYDVKEVRSERKGTDTKGGCHVHDGQNVRYDSLMQQCHTPSSRQHSAVLRLRSCHNVECHASF